MVRWVQGLKQNELVWSRSLDAGATWDTFRVIPMPIPGSAEAPGAMCRTRGDRVPALARAGGDVPRHVPTFTRAQWTLILLGGPA